MDLSKFFSFFFILPSIELFFFTSHSNTSVLKCGAILYNFVSPQGLDEHLPPGIYKAVITKENTGKLWASMEVSRILDLLKVDLDLNYKAGNKIESITRAL